jgi:copper homeostasis protein
MKDSVLEVCVDSLDAARAAEAGGSDRIELCAALSIGGVTPSLGLMTATIEALSIPVHVMIRPRGGGFTRSADEYDQMRKQIGEAKRIGAAGVVLGILHPDGRVDVERSRALVSLAYPMKVTFHRAFDEAPELSEALEAVIQTGAHCLLTSGGEPDVLAGSDAIARLVAQADGRLDVMAGGGVTLANLLKVVRRTGVSYLHGSLTGERKNGGNPKECAQNRQVALEANVREAVRLFRAELSMREARKKILR